MPKQSVHTLIGVQFMVGEGTATDDKGDKTPLRVLTIVDGGDRYNIPMGIDAAKGLADQLRGDGLVVADAAEARFLGERMDIPKGK